MKLDHAFFCGYFIDPLGVYFAQMLNRNRASNLVGHVVSLRVHLQVVLPLGEVEVLHDGINRMFCPPLQVICVHEISLVDVIVARFQEAQQSVIFCKDKNAAFLFAKRPTVWQG